MHMCIRIYVHTIKQTCVYVYTYICLLDSIWSHETHACMCIQFTYSTYIYNKEITLSFCMHIYTYIYVAEQYNIIIYIVVALYSYCLD